MSCDRYWLCHKPEPIYFYDGKVINGETVYCLCTFPENNRDEKLDTTDVRSFALLGAAVALMQKGYIHQGDIPGCLPRWVIDEIDRNLRPIDQRNKTDAVSQTKTDPAETQ